MILLPAICTSIKSRVDKSWSVTFSTPELSPSQMMDIGSMNGKECFLAINITPFNTEQQKMVAELKADEPNGISQSKRMRNIFFRLWEQDNSGYQDFNLFYEFRMNQLCESLKNKLQP